MNDMPPPFAEVSALKLALMAKQVRAQTAQALQADPIAIVGMACRLPGGADTPDRFWQVMRDSVCAVREAPPDRWNGEVWYDPDLSTAGKTVTKSGCFLDRIDTFDADYFGISAREAARMDPQQRLFLEVAIEGLDDAGLSKRMLAGSRTGVFVASYHNDYAQLQFSDPDAIDLRTLTGSLHSVLANRLSYFLDLRGPSISIDTACSASLVAVHLACQSLRLGESNIAVAGGVSLMIAPELLVSMSKVGFMAPDGRCKTFDEAADGFGRGEGCSVVVLKRMSDAIANADRILAVIRGSAVNQDGHSTLLTAPNGPAQQALIRDTLARAQLSPSRIGFVETHGTGTALGDPIEVAIAATIGQPFSGSGPCLLGSVKANLGHLEAAAGATGLIKVVLALQHEAVPGQVNYRRLNPHIQLQGTRLAVPTTLTPWPAGPVARCAAVSSFGIGGTNAHVVIEEASSLPTVARAHATPATDACHFLPLSAKTPAALRDQMQAWTEFLAEPTEAIGDLCHTASQRRTHYDFRVAVVGRSHASLRERLQDQLAQAEISGASSRRAVDSTPRVGFVFGGQGPQWHAMGRELMAEEPVFRAAMAECGGLLRPLSGWSLLDELAMPADQSRLDQTERAQPALFAIQVALAALWRSWGVLPDVVVGHSVGEIAALHVAGVLSLEEAVRIVWHRGRIMQLATGLGRMASVSLSEAEARAVVAPFGDRLSIGAINGPNSIVLSGEAPALDASLATLASHGIDHRLLPVQYAFHSAQMGPLQPSLVDALAKVRSLPPRIAVFSTVTGECADETVFDADYFARNMRQPVRFAQAIGAMSDAGCNLFVELSPHPVLSQSIVECVAPLGREPVVLASMRRGRAEQETLLQACAGLHAAGCDLNWKELQPSGGSVVTLPGYCWQRTRHWIRPRPDDRSEPLAADAWHPLLGRQITVAGIEAHVFEGGSQRASAWLADHRVFGRLLLPGAAMMEMMAATVSKAMHWPAPQLMDFALERPLLLPERDEGDARWQVVVTPVSADRAELALYAAVPAGGTDMGWLLIARAIGLPGADDLGEDWSIGRPPIEDGRNLAVNIIPVGTIYDHFHERGVAFGPAFRCLSDVRLGDGAAQAWIELPITLRHGDDFPAVHPVLIDAALQLCWLAAAGAGPDVAEAALFLPIGADRIALRPGRHDRLRVCVDLAEPATGSTFAANVLIETAEGERVVAIKHMRFAGADQSTVTWARSDDDLYTLNWIPASNLPASNLPSGKPVSASGAWIVFADNGGIADAIAAEIDAAGGSCHLVRVGTAFAPVAERRCAIDPANPDDYRRLFEELGRAGAAFWAGVIHCWSLDMACGGQTEQGRLEQDDLIGAGSLLHLLQCLTSSGSVGPCPAYVLTRGAQDVTGAETVAALQPRAAGLWGLAGVAALEHPELSIRVIDLDPSEGEANGRRLLTELLDRRDARVALRGLERWVPRLQPYAPTARRSAAAEDNRAVQLELVRPGSFDGLELRKMGHAALQPHEVRLRVLSAGINFRDVLTVLQVHPGPPPPLGVECAGVVTEVGGAVEAFRIGDRVFGFAPASLGTEAVVPAAFLARVPDTMRSEDAAGIAVAFLTVYYGFHHLARLRKGERVLVHAAAGGVGLAAVQIAQRCGAEVFATAGSEAKRDLLRRLGVTLVMDSRSVAFADQVLAETGGRGVDVVLNALAGDFIPASIRTLARGGRFLELGKRGIWSAEALAKVRPDVRYHPYDLGALAQADHALLAPMYESILAALADGSLRPLPVTVFPLARAADALRYMAQARHIGKVVVEVAADGAPAGSSAVAISAAATYWITGGLGALGQETADWLIRAGARHLVLSGRRPPTDSATLWIRELEQRGAAIRVFQADAADRSQAQFILHEIARTMPPLRGVVHAAGVLRDAALINQRWSEAQDVLRGKAHGAWLVHELTQDLPLDFFILYSAAGVVLGAPGQGLYPAANAELDALARFRRRLGLKALSVAWGKWSGAGMAADLADCGHDVWKARGLRSINAADGFVQLERLLADHAPYGAVIPIDWAHFLRQLPSGADRDFFEALAPAATSLPDTARSAAAVTMPERLRELPAALRRQALITQLTERVRLLLGHDNIAPVDTRVPLKEIGLDSLMAVELRNVLVRSGGAPLPTTLLFDYPTLDALSSCLGRIWRLDDGGAPAVMPAVERMAPPDVRDIADLSEEDAEALLNAELALATARENS
jgi:acyl transferase domain-containing protein/NADPH:quinone reductase-like Zn-dependent oxidoreductase